MHARDPRKRDNDDFTALQPLQLLLDRPSVKLATLDMAELALYSKQRAVVNSSCFNMLLWNDAFPHARQEVRRAVTPR